MPGPYIKYLVGRHDAQGLWRVLAATAIVASVLAACSPQSELDLSATSPGRDVPAPALPVQDTAPPAAMAFSSGNRPGLSTARSAASAQNAAQPEKFYIEFRSRSAQSYGHTFASVGKLDKNGAIATSEIVGLHPATDSPIPWMIGHLVPVPSETGPSDGDTEDIYFTSRYRISMDKDRYDRLMVFIRDLQKSSPVWHAVFYNCNAFVGDIARHMGLSAPGNTLLFPKDYIDELRSLNRS